MPNATDAIVMGYNRCDFFLLKLPRNAFALTCTSSKSRRKSDPVRMFQ
jgi:hypothetical protein